MTSFNPDLLKVARQAAGKSQAALASSLEITQAAISKMEAGLLQPSAEVLARLAEQLDVPQSFFFEQDRVVGLPVSVQYRKRASVGQRATEQVEAAVNLRLFQLRRLLRSVDVTRELELPCVDPDEAPGGSAASVAILLRRMWLVPRGPIRNLTDYVERAGVVVIPCDFQALGVDGLTYSVNGLPTCVFLNSQMPGDRQRFTLAHELGHVVMHRLPNAEMERQADEFAAELLMPAADIRSAFATGVSLVRLAELKQIWRVSMGALLVRAKSLGVLSEEGSTHLWKQMSRAGYRTAEPESLAVVPETPRVFDDIVKTHLGHLGFSVGDLAEALHMTREGAVELARRPHDRGGLRLVHSV